jgi:vesicle-fusing ATPase
MSRKGAVVLQVGNLPSNRLALTNRVYLSPTVHGHLVEAAASKSSSSASASSTYGGPLVSVGPHVYIAEGHPSVPDDKIALNGLQRRFAQLSLANRVEVRPYDAPAALALATMEIGVDTLKKSSSGGDAKGAPPREVDTDRLASDFLLNYEGHVFERGQTLAMDFEGTMMEMQVGIMKQMDLGGKGGGDGGDGGDDDGGAGAIKGQFLAPTVLTFSRPQGSKSLSLVGTKVAGGSGGGANTIFLSDFDFEKLGIGGLDAEFNQIFRRAFASRIWPAHVIKQLGINHVRGMLLFGPPGCGKTLIARQIGKVLNAREPKIVNGPEILNKFVGGSEEKVRELFADAEKEQLEMGDHSMLHIIILDEMDAICKSRGANRSDSGVSDSVVNQLLSKIDGVDSLNNILLIGMTNRKDMIDDALLRPGRLEVHVEIGLPDHKGRLQILGIHTKSMNESKRISPEVMDKLGELSDKTKNFSGAEIEGLVKAATSYALTRCVDVKDLSKAPDDKNLIVRYDDFQRALDDVSPKFGAKSSELRAMYRNGFVPYGDSFDLLMGNMERLVEQGENVLSFSSVSCVITRVKSRIYPSVTPQISDSTHDVQ